MHSAARYTDEPEGGTSPTCQGKGVRFHCDTCGQEVRGRNFIPRDEHRVTCADCFFGKQDLKQCHICKQPITEADIFGLGESTYHQRCFCCTVCKRELATVKFITKDGAPYCSPCYDTTFGKKCHGCKNTIAQGGSKYIPFEGKFWHAACFACQSCKTNLAGQSFVFRNEQISCGDCARAKSKQASGKAS